MIVGLVVETLAVEWWKAGSISWLNGGRGSRLSGGRDSCLRYGRGSWFSGSGGVVVEVVG